MGRERSGKSTKLDDAKEGLDHGVGVAADAYCVSRGFLSRSLSLFFLEKCCPYWRLVGDVDITDIRVLGIDSSTPHFQHEDLLRCSNDSGSVS